MTMHLPVALPHLTGNAVTCSRVQMQQMLASGAVSAQLKCMHNIQHTVCFITCPAEPSGSSCPRCAPRHPQQIGVSGEPAEAPTPCHRHPRSIALESAASQYLAPTCIQLGTDSQAWYPAEHALWTCSGCIQAQAFAAGHAGGRCRSTERLCRQGNMLRLHL